MSNLIDKRNILTLTRAQLIEWLRGIGPKAKIIHAVCHTEPRMNKTNNPYYGRVTKVTEGNGVINYIYANSVVRAQGKSGVDEPAFTPQPRKWGTRIPGTPLVEHFKGGQLCYYVEIKWNASPTVSYLLDGRVSIDASELAPFMPSRNVQQQADHQGVDAEHVVRVTDYSADSIVQVNADGFAMFIR